MRRALSLGAAMLLSAVGAHASEIDEVLQALLDQALSVRITTRVTQHGEETVQSYDLTRVTVSGRAVRLRLEGGNLTIIAEFTPYEDDEGYLLVAEGRILLREENEEEVQYVTSLRSIPMQTGERVVFYPLGKSALNVDLATDSRSDLNVELEVEISPYQDPEE